MELRHVERRQGRTGGPVRSRNIPTLLSVFGQLGYATYREAVLRFTLRSLVAEPAPGSARHRELTSLAIPDAHRHSK